MLEGNCMSLSKEQIRMEALQLAADDRTALAEELLLSIPAEEQEAIDASWLEEVRRRDAEFKARKLSSTPAEVVIERLRRKAAR
jgi:putative addiction module component (TIGR02574 family)